jgi:hypothetical protein
MQALSRSESRHVRTVFLAVVGVLVAASLALVAGPAGAAAPTNMAPAPQACPGFRVLHNDRIGAAVFPAGTYTITNEASGLTCKSSAELFARFLEDFDGVLPKPWTVSPESSGNASFLSGGGAGFSVSLTKKDEGGGTNPDLGSICPNTFTVNSTTVVGALRFTKGKFLIALPTGTAISCNQAVVLFQRFLGAGGPLPRPWKLVNQTATFYKPAIPVRSAFRIEPLAGSGRR